MKKTLIFAISLCTALLAQAETRTISANTTIENETIVADGSNPAIIVKSGKVLTLNNVTVSSKAATGTIVLLNKAQLVVNGGSISNTNDKNYGAAAVFTYATTATHPTSTYYPNVITINGAKLSGQWGITLNCGSSTVNMADGEIAAGEYGIVIFASNANLNISGGKLTNIVRTSSGSVATKVTGGSYKDPLAETYYNAEEYEFGKGITPYNYLLAKIADKGFTSEIENDKVVDVVTITPPAGVVSYKVTIDGGTPTTQDDTKVSFDYSTLADKDEKVGTVEVAAVDESGNELEKVTMTYVEVDSSAEDTTLSVPFENMKIDDILDTSKLTTGDTLKVYDAESQTIQLWELGSDGKWEAIQNAGSTDTPSKKIPQGAAVVLTRQNTSSKIQMKGIVGGEIIEQTAEAPEAGSTKTLTSQIGNPKGSTMNLDEVMTGSPKTTSSTVVGDKILIQAEDGSFTEYLYRNDGWYVKKTTTTVNEKTGITMSKTTYTKVNPVVKPGRSFFYRSAGGKAKFKK